MTSDEMKAYINANMARHKVPKYIEFVDAFPMNAAGKVLKADTDYKVTYDLAEGAWGEAQGAESFKHNQFAELVTPVREGYKFVGWFERPYYTQPNEKPITEIDASLLTQDVQLYAIYEPVRTLYKYDSTWKIWDLEVAKNLIKCVYVLWDNANAKLYDTSEIANGRLVKAMPNFAAPSYILRDFRNSVNVYHPYSLSSTSKATLYSTTSSSYDTSKNTTGVEYFYVYLDGNKLPSSYMPDPSVTALATEE